MIDVLIINYNTRDYLQRLLNVLTVRTDRVRSRRARYTVTVVDNHSTDDSVRLVQRNYPWVRVIARPTNDGYSAAVNEGMAQTQNREVLLLNSDILITPHSVAGLIRIWERHGFQGIVAPLHLEPDGFPQLTWGTHPTVRAEARRKRLDRALARRKPWAKHALLAESCRTRQVDWVSGSCMLFSRQVYEEVGPWDECFFLYFEDIDWCLRARRLGIPIYHTPEVRVIHGHGVSVARHSELAEREYRYSQCYFTQKHFGTGQRLRLQTYLAFKMIGRLLCGKVSGHKRAASWRIFKQVLARPLCPERAPHTPLKPMRTHE